MFKGFENMTDAERGAAFGRYQLRSMLLAGLRDLTLDEAIQAWFDAQAEVLPDVNAGCRGAAENHYSTMSIDALCALPVGDLAAADAVLLMWCTWPQMQEGLRLMTAWGFRYVTGFPWIKVTDVSKTLWDELTIEVPYGIGFWARGCSEFVLIGRRGNARPPEFDFIGLLSPNLHHSRKPESLHHYAMSLPGPWLELFARRPYPGFDVWGNEVMSTVELEASTA